uniref:Progesterone receptor n=1 Tax=Takifugu rubripes TaxID=31033 RepID=H2U8X4_TAKRU
MIENQVPTFLDKKEDYRKASLSLILSHTHTHTHTHTAQLHDALQPPSCASVLLDTKSRMSGFITSAADSTDTRMSNLAGHHNKISMEPQSVACMSSSVRNFGEGSAPIHDDRGAFRDCNILDDSLVGKHFYDRNSEFLKCDNVAWEDLINIQETNGSSSETLPGTSLRMPSKTGACKFIKDERDASVLMDSACPNFEPSPDIPALDTCCDTDKKQQLGLSGAESTSFPAVSPAPPRPGLDGLPNFLVDLNQPEQLRAAGQKKAESRCDYPGKAAASFDTNRPSVAHLSMYNGDVTRWTNQTSLAEPQYWCQPAGLTEDAFLHNAYDGIQNQTAAQRNLSSLSAFPGMPPQRLCVICSDEASGCHYGVLTCGSCKVFFKRAVEGHHSYLCAGRNDCIVDKIRRKNCPACRLRKCYQAGMMLGGRKLKRFGSMKTLGFAPSLIIREVQFSQQIMSILENIEPEVVCAGHDNTQPDAPHLLNSLNRLCEKQLLWIVKWSKSLPGFRNLHISDQMTLIQYSWMNLMVFSLGWRSFQNVTSEFLYFAPDLVLSQEEMRRSPISDLCLSIQFVPQEFANLQVSREEFLCMKAILLLNTVPLEGLKSQAAFEEMRQNYIRELTKAIHMKEKGFVASSQRFYHLTKLMDAMHDIVKKINLFCLSTFIQADSMKVEFPEMMTEVIASQLPKVLAGMVRPLLFHNK